MKPLLNITPLLVALLLPLSTFAEGELCTSTDPSVEVFGKYQAKPDSEINDHCVHKVYTKKTASGYDKRTTTCIETYEKMREISGNYLNKRTTFCQTAQKAATCAAGSTQATCVADAGKISAAAQAQQRELGTVLESGKDKIKKLDDFHRLRKEKMKQDLAALSKLKPVDKLKPSISTSQSTANTSRPPMKTDVIPTQPVSSVTDREPSGLLNAQDGNAPNLAEYERRLPAMIRDTDLQASQLREFDQVREMKFMEHSMKSQDFGTRAGQLFLSAEKMGYVDPEIQAWKRENPEALSEAKKQGPAEVHVGGETAIAGADGNLEGEGKSVTAPSEKTGKISVEDAKAAALAAAESKAEEKSDAKADPVLEAFETRLSEERATGANERAIRLRDMIRQKLMGEKTAAKPVTDEKVPGSFVEELIASHQGGSTAVGEAFQESGKRELSSLGVSEAKEEMERQLRELDRQAGILEIESKNLFERVQGVHKGWEKILAKAGGK